MLQKLSIKNYALIASLEIDFDRGLTMITGETGAGKSILLGALGLIMGNRADSGQLMDTDKKCVIEAQFLLQDNKFKSLFEELDLDFESETIIRRELLPSGKSRSFVNDTPVNLNVLQELKPLLIDIHSQHQTLDVTSEEFQYDLLDLLNDQLDLRNQFNIELKLYNAKLKQRKELVAQQNSLEQQFQYNKFLLEELEVLNLESLNIEHMESRAEILENSVLIQEELANCIHTLQDDTTGVLAQVSSLKSTLSRLSGISNEFEGLYNRIESCSIELNDITDEAHRILDASESNPEELNELNEQLSSLFDLRKKHAAIDLNELIDKRNALRSDVELVTNFEVELTVLDNEIQTSNKELIIKTKALTQGRTSVVEELKSALHKGLGPLGMENASFSISLVESNDFNPFGKDVLTFEFSANKGGQFASLKRNASGGELSRIMLVVKSILAKYRALPTLIFDEIDTGVSGEVALNMGQIMKNMSRDLQIIAISHLPQVAALGSSHLKVFKKEVDGRTQSFVQRLQREERIHELAEMLGGKAFTESAINHAKELLLD
ncbi:DNA repair protein RecN [Flavobacteriaceae bacterium]|nr:DNA repair protein RecN [Flavobacteriaceae bacterium]